MKYVTGIVLMLISIFLSAFALSTLWGWFIVPLGVPAIGMAHAFGLSVMYSFLTVKVRKQKRTEDESSFNAQVVGRIIMTLFSLLLGWIGVSLM